MTNRNDDNLVRTDPIVETIGEAKNALNPNVATLNARCLRSFGDTLFSTTYLLKQSQPQARLQRFVESRGSPQLLLCLREESNSGHLSWRSISAIASSASRASVNPLS
jgi:hypothetical protein